MVQAIMMSCLAVSVLTVSAWMHINNKDGSGWGMVALVLIITSCNTIQASL